MHVDTHKEADSWPRMAPRSPMTTEPRSSAQVNDWMEREGSRCLQALSPVDICAETVEKVHAEFEDFFLQVAVCSRAQDAKRSLRWGLLGPRCRGGKVQGSFQGQRGDSLDHRARGQPGPQRHHLRFCLLQEVFQDQVQRSQNLQGFLKMQVPRAQILASWVSLKRQSGMLHL